MSEHHGLAQRLEADWDKLTAKLHKQAHETTDPSGSSRQENTMTTPQQSVVDSLHQLTGEIAANKLVSRLVQYGIGKRLTDQQADHLVTVIADMEQPPPVPQFTPHDDGTQQPAG